MRSSEQHPAPGRANRPARWPVRVAAVLWLVIATAAAAGETERLPLSGAGADDAVEWEFRVSDGRRAGGWTTIPVPSQWELHGFGRYNYGHDDDPSDEVGEYRHRFRVPPEWRGRQVDLVFDGVMTDAEVLLNGRRAGPTHRGAFYRFRYPVSELLDYDGENLLAVTVRKRSADRSVNRAERDADYWVFGGIFRPVWLEARPPEAVARLAIDARHDGALRVRVGLRGLDGAAEVVARVETADGEATGAPLAARVAAGTGEVWLAGRIPGVRPWSAERPTLYVLTVALRRGGETLHVTRERFGFRTVELRPDGLFVNGGRVRLKGVNRHAFWPSSGRTLSRALDVRDAELVKAMNMNAVRAAHYPPDESFLDACDELGLYVLDELAGWHDAYGDEVGRKLVREMVERDRNRPSVIAWTNGNEGGWNTNLDAEFARHDPQGRPVLHPHAVFGGVDATHYPTYEDLAAALDPGSWRNRWRALWGELPLVLPTEALHGLYDGGSGAGLADYWTLLASSPRGAGIFLWSFADEAVVRTDRGGVLDADGNHAPDGILGPFRERTANFYAVRELFAPVTLVETRLDAPRVTVSNRFDETDLADCSFAWSLVDLPVPGEPWEPAARARGTLAGPAAAPGGRGVLELPLPEDWRDAGALRLTAFDPHGRDVWTWVLPIAGGGGLAPAADGGLAPTLHRSGAGSSGERGDAEGRVVARERAGRLVLTAGDAEAVFDLATGGLVALRRGERVLPLAGPRRARDAASASRPRGGAPAAVRHRPDGDGYLVEAGDVAGLDAARRPDGDGYRAAIGKVDGLDAVRWRFDPAGWLRLEYAYSTTEALPFHGIRLALPEDAVRRLRWLGAGPGRVWANRLAGGTLGVWAKDAAAETPDRSGAEPKLRGLYADVRWAEVATADGVLTVAFETPGPFLGILSPTFPDDARDAVARVPPPGGLGILHAIPAIGTKFHPAPELGPQSRPHPPSGPHRGVVWLRLRSVR